MSGSISATTMAYIAIGTAVASAAGGAYSSISSSEAASSAAKYNAAVANNNQTIANSNATLAIQSGEAQAGQELQKTRANVGAIKAAQAANGVDVDSGSADAVQRSAAELGEESAINIRANAVRQAYGYQTQSMNFNAQSQLDTAQAQQDQTSGMIGAGSSVINGIANADGAYNKYVAGV